jgi:hypothetical protein
MKLLNFTKTAGPAALLATVAFIGMLAISPRGRADDDGGGGDNWRAQQGMLIAPVPLNMKGRDSNLVGLGSYLVNALGDCNGCHNSGGPPNFNYASDHNPYFLFQKSPTKVDPSTYLAGGGDFGPALPFNVGAGAAYGSYVGPDMIARNLTPNGKGLPEGGHSFTDFLNILRTGVDMDKIHPTCTGSPSSPYPANCIPPPVDGSRLQVMPWPVFSNMSDHDILAIWTYLSAIPCIDNTTGTPPAGAPNELRNNCGH